MKKFLEVLAALAASAAFGWDPPRYDGRYETNGVSYAQVGGLSQGSYVVTNVAAAAGLGTNEVSLIAAEYHATNTTGRFATSRYEGEAVVSGTVGLAIGMTPPGSGLIRPAVWGVEYAGQSRYALSAGAADSAGGLLKSGFGRYSRLAFSGDPGDPGLAVTYADGGHGERTNVVAFASSVPAGAARPLPPYLHALDYDDTYPADAEWYYEFADAGGACSSVRSGNDYSRNFDFPYDGRAEFVVRMAAGPGRFASVGVSNVGTNLTEEAVTSGRPSRFYKALPGATVDGVNERGVAANVNVVPANGAEGAVWPGREINALGGVRWVLDRATDAGTAASNLAAKVYIPDSLVRRGYSAHFMVADERETWIVEDGEARKVDGRAVLTNYRLFADDDPYGTGYERYDLLAAGGSITSAWFRAAYRRPFARPTEFAAPGVGTHSDTNALLAWAEANVPQGAPESLARGGGSWQTVHCSVYDLSNRVLRVAVQERDDWYVFAVPGTAVDLAPLEGRVAANAANIATNAAAIAAIPRIAESASNPGWAANANRAAYAIAADRAGAIGPAPGPLYTADAIEAIELAATNAAAQAAANAAAIESHVTNYSNPHGVTMEEVGITPSSYRSDAVARADRSDSTARLDSAAGDYGYDYYAVETIENAATNAAARAAANAAAIESHVADAGNPHGVTAEQAGALPFADGAINVRAEVYDQWYFYGGLFLCNGSDNGIWLFSDGPRARRLVINTDDGRFYTPAAKGGGTFALTSDIPDVSGIASNAEAIVEVALSATNYTDAATNAALAAAKAYTDAHTGGVAQVEYVYSADGFRRHDVDGNLFEAVIVTGGVFRVVSTKPDRRFDRVHSYTGKHYNSSGVQDGYKWEHTSPGTHTTVVYYMREGKFWIDDVGDLLAYKDLNPVNGDDMSPTNTLPNVTVTFTPQGAPVWPSEPIDRFARPSDVAAETARAIAAEASVALAAADYTDSATNETLTAAMAYTDAHTNTVNVEYVYSADGFRRHDVDGNLYDASVETNGVWTMVVDGSTRRFRFSRKYSVWYYWKSPDSSSELQYDPRDGKIDWNNWGGLAYAKAGLDPSRDDLNPTSAVRVVTSLTFTPQGEPVWPSEPSDRFARSSVIAAETARAVAAEAAVALSATNYTDSATNSLWEFKRDRTDLAVYEPANERWTWTSADTNAPSGWLDEANAYAAPKPVHDGVGWTVAQIGNSPMYAAPTEPATGTSLEFAFKVSKFGTRTFVATAARASATDTAPVPVSGQALVRTHDLASLTNQPGTAVGLGSSCSGTGSAIGQNAHALNNGAVAVGAGAQTSAQNGVAVGGSSQAGAMYSAAVGPGAKTGSSATYSVQLGPGTCNTANTLQFCSVPIGKTDAWMSEFTLDAAVVVPQATNALSEAKAYTDGKIGDISAVLDAILGGH